jgi:hypothetical protein
MKESRIIEVNGIFLGAAISLPDQHGWQFVAADARAEPANGLIGATYQATTALARQAYWAALPAAA